MNNYKKLYKKTIKEYKEIYKTLDAKNLKCAEGSLRKYQLSVLDFAKTIISYIDYLLDSFLIEKVQRYDVKGKRYIQTPQKYYFADVGLRNARLNFRQQEENHLMENIIYNELLRRGYNVDVGVVELRTGGESKQLEVDFVCNLGNKRYYIQSVLDLPTREKTIQEERPLMNIDDNFKKIIIKKGNFNSWYTEEGILVLSIIDFLLDEKSLDR